MCYMVIDADQVGVRELRQNLSVYLARIARGETLEVTDRGRAVAILAPLPRPVNVIDRLKSEGRLVPATGDLLTLKRPRTTVSRQGTEALQKVRADRRL